ncbi:RNA-directed DNA polymerase, eukaryota, reverse transcriptase zinc-binding domain protein [Tanacetum coccineum]
MAPSASQALLFDVHYDSVFFFSPLRYEHGLTLQLRVTNDNRLDFSSVSEHLRERAQQNLYAMFYVIPECDLEKGLRIIETDFDVYSMDEEASARLLHRNKEKDAGGASNMGKPITNTDPDGWTWIFRKNKFTTSKPIHNPYQKDLEKTATSFYVTNFPDSINAKDLWTVCTPFGRLVDAFIANKRSKGGKRFGFICYVGVNDITSFVRSLSNIWIGSFHLYVTTARFQRPNSIKPNLNPKPHASHNGAMENPNPKPKNTTRNSTDIPTGKPSFVSVVHGSTKSSTNTSQPVKSRTVSLTDQDLIRIDDATTVLLVKLKDIKSMSNMHLICKDEGSVDLKIHHIGGLWIWIQFPTPEACVAFQSNSTNIVDENDNSQDSASSEDENELEKVADTFDDNLADDTEDIIKDLAVDKDEEVVLEKSPEDVNGDLEFPLNESGSPALQSQKEENLSDLSCPPVFEHLKKGETSRCSTSFSRYRKKDIKGFSLIQELSKIIEVGGSLGYDVRGCRKSLNRMINGIGVHIVDK